MSESENLASAKEGYEAFGRGDAEGAMKDISDDIEWTVPGNSAISGTHRGKEELGAHWAQLAEKNPRIEVQHMLADGDLVVVLSHVTLDGGEYDNADVMTYRDGQLVKFQSAGDTALSEQIFGSK